MTNNGMVQILQQTQQKARPSHKSCLGLYDSVMTGHYSSYVRDSYSYRRQHGNIRACLCYVDYHDHTEKIIGGLRIQMVLVSQLG
eukprot:scaffold7864_cov122-Skeletonema_dohrnii-CCMP3373.AAC.8